MNPKYIGIAAALGSAASWAVGSILFKRLGERLSSPAMTLAKEILSVGLLAIALTATGLPSASAHAWGLLAVSGLLGIALGDTFFFAGLKDLGPVALLVLVTLGQVLTIGLAVLFLGERPAKEVWYGILLVLAGVAVVMFDKLGGEQGSTGWRGLFFGLASVFCMSISMIIAKQALDSVGHLPATFARMLSGAAGMTLFGLATRQVGGWLEPFRDPRLAAGFVVAVAVVTFGGFWLTMVAYSHLDVAVANTLTSIEPVLVLPLAVIVLKEKVSLRAVLGTLVTVAGVVLICITGAQPAHEEPATPETAVAAVATGLPLADR